MNPDTFRVLDQAGLTEAVNRLLAADPHGIGQMIAAAGPPPLRRQPGGLSGLIRIVIAQQVSTASANAIHARFIEQYGAADHEDLLSLTDGDFRTCGLSLPKIRTIRHLCSAIDEGRLDMQTLDEMDSAAGRDYLTSVKGIGPWTADIYFLFCLGHPDVWPSGDLALQEGVKLALGLRTRPDAARLDKIARRWRPWRAVAARIIWAYYGVARPAVSRTRALLPKTAGRGGKTAKTAEKLRKR